MGIAHVIPIWVLLRANWDPAGTAAGKVGKKWAKWDGQKMGNARVKRGPGWVTLLGNHKPLVWAG